MIKTDMLRYFVTVANCGNLIDAGDKLGRTPSAISMMLKQLEDHLGAPLFESERKNKLTALGVFTLEEAIRELDHFERTVTTIENYAHAKVGSVRIAVVPSVAEFILPGVVKEFRQHYPDVHIDIRDMDSSAVLREIVSERVDLGIASDSEKNGKIAREKLFSDTFGIVCRSDHPLSELVNSQQFLSWEMLAPWTFIANGMCVHILDKAAQDIFDSSKLMVRNTTSLLALVRAGIGVTILPRLVIENIPDELVFIPISDPLAMRRIDILYRVHYRLSSVSCKFKSLVQTHALSVEGNKPVERNKPVEGK